MANRIISVRQALDMLFRKNKEINQNLIVPNFAYTDLLLANAIDAFINENGIDSGVTKKACLGTASGWFTVTIVRSNDSSYYTGTAIALTNDERYTFRGSIEGGASTVINPFSSKAELLWTNPAPTSAFPAQTVPVDTNKYKAFIIVSRQDSNWVRLSYSYITSDITVMGSSEASRTATITSSGISFSNANAYDGPTNRSTIALPQKIYGLKDELIK